MSDIGLVEYVLVGSMKGKSGKFMGQTFIKGRAMVPKDVHVAVGHVLKQDYAAIPLYEHQEKTKDKSKAETVVTPAIKEPIAPDPFAKTETETETEDIPEEDVPEEDVPETEVVKKKGKK